MADLEGLPEIDDTDEPLRIRDTDGLIEGPSGRERDAEDPKYGPLANPDSVRLPDQSQPGYTSGPSDTPPVSTDWAHLIEKGGNAAAGIVDKATGKPVAPGDAGRVPQVPGYRPGQPLVRPSAGGSAVALVGVGVGVLVLAGGAVILLRGRRRRRRAD